MTIRGGQTAARTHDQGINGHLRKLKEKHETDEKKTGMMKKRAGVKRKRITHTTGSPSLGGRVTRP